MSLYKPEYDEKRTDDIEVLFKSAYYLQLVDNCEAAFAIVKEQLIQAFSAFPIEFDKDKKASRFSNPYRYHENGVVTFTSGESGHELILDAWTPENRPVPRKKAVSKSKPTYLPILKTNPIWYLQVMAHRGRKATAHLKHAKYGITKYAAYYNEMKIYKTLPEDEQKAILTTQLEQRNEMEIARAFHLFKIQVYHLNTNRSISGKNTDRFFLLNENEIESLAEAAEMDAVQKKIDSNSRNENKHTIDVLTQLLDSNESGRVPIMQRHIECYKEEARENRFGAHYYPLDHEKTWELLHRKYLHLDDSQLAALSELKAVDLQLLQEIKDEPAITE